MSFRIDLKGQTFGSLTVLKYVGVNKARYAVWLCRCACGNLTRSSSGNLRFGSSLSCGCGRSRPKHGHAVNYKPSSTYRTWQFMIQRCTNPNRKDWHLYGGAGVRVCAAWRTFKGFYLSMGKRPAGTTLGRFKDTGDYKPSNCAWMTRAQQRAEARKKRRLHV